MEVSAQKKYNVCRFPEWSVPCGRVWVRKGVAMWMVKDLGLQAITGTAKAEAYILKRPLKTEFQKQLGSVK